MIAVYVGLGSNLGEREAQIRSAIEQLGKMPRSRFVKASSVYDTDPVGDPDQPRFLNAVACIETELTPGEVLWNLLLIEQRLGRVRSKTRKWGPRTIDLDLIFYGDQVVEEENLTVPHPEAHLRAFVLAPLAELAPDLVHPALGERVVTLLAQLPSDAGVRKGDRIWP